MIRWLKILYDASLPQNPPDASQGIRAALLSRRHGRPHHASGAKAAGGPQCGARNHGRTRGKAMESMGNVEFMWESHRKMVIQPAKKW